jgi:hypothetical protein
VFDGDCTSCYGYPYDTPGSCTCDDGPEDECGDCNGTGMEEDINNVWCCNFDSITDGMDNCGFCGGNNYYEDCVAVGSDPPPNDSCTHMDCLGDCDGDATLDDCGVCNGEGPTLCSDSITYECDLADCPLQCTENWACIRKWIQAIFIFTEITSPVFSTL